MQAGLFPLLFFHIPAADSPAGPNQAARVIGIPIIARIPFLRDPAVDHERPGLVEPQTSLRTLSGWKRNPPSLRLLFIR